jgi:hypothetical protein
MPRTMIRSDADLLVHDNAREIPNRGDVPSFKEALLCSALQYRGAAIKIEGDRF